MHRGRNRFSLLLRKGGILLFALGLPVYTQNSPAENKPYPFALINPDSGVELIEGSLAFRWEKKENPDISESMIDYFEIFLHRMKYCRKSAEYLGYKFKLLINDIDLI